MTADLSGRISVSSISKIYDQAIAQCRFEQPRTGTDLVRPHTCLPATFHSWKPFHCRSRRPNPTISPECPSEKIRLDPTNSEYATRVPFWSRIFSRKFGCRHCRRLVPQTGIRLAGTVRQRLFSEKIKALQGVTRLHQVCVLLHEPDLAGRWKACAPIQRLSGRGIPPTLNYQPSTLDFQFPLKRRIKASQAFTSLHQARDFSQPLSFASSGKWYVLIPKLILLLFL